MAAEIHRKNIDTVVLALHPGEVMTDMSNIEVDWFVEGVITPKQSVEGMLEVIAKKGKHISEHDTANKGKATFWTWEGKEYPW